MVICFLRALSQYVLMKNKKPLLTNRIADVRKEKGLTQQDLADKVGVHWITISKLERGLIRLSEKWIIQLMQALEVGAEDLLAADRPLTAFELTGRIADNGVVKEEADDDSGFVTITNDMFVAAGRSWFLVDTDAFFPAFHRGDILAFDAMLPTLTDNYLNRFAMVFVHDEDGGQRIFYGHVQQSPIPERYSLSTVNGRVLTVEIATIAPLSMAFYNVHQISVGKNVAD